MATIKGKAVAASAASSKSATASSEQMVATFPDPPDKEKARAMAELALRPGVSASVVLTEYTKAFGALDLAALIESLSAATDEMSAGDMKGAEAMLFGQAHALQAIFMNLARRAVKQDYLKQWEAYLRMALKAQNQCRMTLETLATIKNPPAVFARQANINNGGQQQVNNGASAETEPVRADVRAHAVNPAIEQTGLLEASDGERLDTGAAGTASRADPHLATLGALDGAAHR